MCISQSNARPLPPARAHDDAPRLFTYSARTEEALNHVMTTLTNQHSGNLELHTLLQETAITESTAFPYRGYACLNMSDINTFEIQVRLHLLCY